MKMLKGLTVIRNPEIQIPRYIFVLVVVLSLLIVSASGQPSATKAELEKLTIGSIEVAGNQTIGTTVILSKVRSRTDELFIAATADEDAKRIAELDGVEYAYYNTVVADNKVKLTFVVIEKNLVRAIVFNGNRKYKASTLKKKLDFRIGDYLDKFLVEAGRERLLEFYHKKGFAFATIETDLRQVELGRVVYNISEGARAAIKKVAFVGNEGINSSELRKVIKTGSKKWFFFRRYYNRRIIDEDVTRLRKAYQKKGFLDARIAAAPEFVKDNREVFVTFSIAEGTVYVVDKIVIRGNSFLDDKTLRSGLKLKEHKVYNAESAGLDVSRITKRYRQSGFIDVEVTSHRRFVGAGKLAVELEIKEAGRFRIGRVNITGNTQTHDKVVRRVLDEKDFKPGRWYNADIARGNGQGELEKEIRRIVMTESATITPIGTKPAQRDAQVTIVEGQTGMVMVGAGIDSSSGMIGQLVFEQRNFDITDTPESLREFITGRAFKGAGQKMRIALEPGTEMSRYSVSFTEPYLEDKPISLDVAGSRYMRALESYDEQRTRGYVRFEERLKNRWRRGVTFRLENVDVGDLDSDAPSEISSVKGDNFLAGIRLSVSRDLTDNRFNPSRGTIINAGYEQLGGDHTFGILSGTYRRYETVHEDLAGQRTIAAYKLHAATTLGDAPPFEKFYAGGIGSIRGFDYRGVSTRANNDDKDPIGSDWVFLANAEVTVPLVSENFSALLFVDSGTVDTGNYRVSVGAGIQILIPQWFGPVPMRFELAAPLMKDDDDDVQAFSFSVGRLF